MTRAAAAGRGDGRRGQAPPEADVSEACRASLLDQWESSESARLQLYGASEACAGACKRTSKSPNCFCSLVPAAGSHRESGLWARTPKGTYEAPSSQRRTDAEQPVGLNNLGATCYVNAVLQVLFSDARFRRHIFALEPAVLERSLVLRLLRQLFAQLHGGASCSADPSEFAKALELDSKIQQDGQEFMKLLLQLIESTLSGGGGFVPQLFCGQTSRGVTCLSCGERSSASRKLVDCYELELNVGRGCNTLAASLANYLEVEELSGANAYVCDSQQCRGDKRTAQLATRIHATPPLLNLSLKRFVFDPKKACRKKVTDRFFFPAVLDMGAHLSPSEGGAAASSQAGNGAVYDLVAILLHRGSAATSGHYLAHVRSADGSTWWRFDDETVTRLGAHPLGETKDAEPAAAAGDAKKKSKAAKGGAKAAKGGAATQKGDSVETAIDVDAGPNTVTPKPSRSRRGAAPEAARTPVPPPASEPEVVVVEEGAGAEAPLAGHYGSTEAYMLMYARRGPGDSAAAAPSPTVLPPDLAEHVQACNVAFEAQLAARAAASTQSAAERAARQASVRSVLATIQPEPSPAPLQNSRWISTEWLTKWAGSEALPGQIDNGPIMCTHGRLALSAPAEGKCKRVSEAAWAALHAENKGGPELGGADALCTLCLQGLAAEHRSRSAAQQRREALQQRVHELLSGDKEEAGAQVLADHRWLRKWVDWKGGPSGIPDSVGPVQRLLCCHGQLGPGEARYAKPLPASLWEELCAEAAAAEASAAAARRAEEARARAKEAKQKGGKTETMVLDGDGDLVEEAEARADTPPPPPSARAHPRIPFTTTECSQCSSGTEALKEQRLAEKQQLPRLLANKALPLHPLPLTLTALPARFLSAWRAYCSTNGQPRPGAPSSYAADRMLCEHGRLLPQLPAPRLDRKRWMLMPQEGEGEAWAPVELVLEAEADQLRDLYAESAAFPSVRVEEAEASDGGNPRPLFVSTPPECLDCRAAARERQRTAAAVFTDASISVVIKRAPRGARGKQDGEDEDEDSDSSSAKQKRRRVSANGAAAEADPTPPLSPGSAAAAVALKASAMDAGRAPARPTSVRRTRGNRGRGGEAAITVNSTDKLATLKAHILQKFEVPVHSLYLGGRSLGDDDQVTLGEAGITAGCRVFCAVGEGSADDAILRMVGSLGGGGPAELERGFAGTVLFGAAKNNRSADDQDGDVIII